METKFGKIKNDLSELSKGEIVQIITEKTSESRISYYVVKTVNDVELLVRGIDIDLIPNKKILLFLSMNW